MTFRCAHCGVDTPRLTIGQTRCPDCERRVVAQIAADAKRRAPRFPFSKDMTGHAA